MAEKGAVAVDPNVVDEPMVKLGKGKRLFFVAVLYTLFLLDFAIRYGVNAILPLIQGDLGITDTQVGLLGSCVFLGMAVFVMPISYLGEQKSQRRAITLCTVLWSGVTILCGFAQSAALLAVSRFGVGAGNSAYAPLSTAMLTSWYKKSSWGKVLGMYNTAMVLGGAIGYVLFVAVAEAIGWRNTFYAIGGISLVFSLFTLFLPDNKKIMREADQAASAAKGEENKPSVMDEKLNLKDTVKLVVSNRALISMCCGAGLAVLALNAVSTWISMYYVRVMGLSLGAAAGIVAITTPINVLAYPIGGAILDKWYKKDKRARMWMPMLCLLLAATGLASGFAFQSIPLIIFGNAAYALGNTAFHTASHELVPAWYKSISYGTYVLFIQLLGAVGPTAAGIISDAIGLQPALICIQALFLVAAMFIFFAGTQYLKFYQRARDAEAARGLNL